MQHRYVEFVLGAVEHYKDTLARGALVELGNEAAQRIFAGDGPPPLLTEVALLEAVDLVIAERLRLPDYRQWRADEGVIAQATNAILGPTGAPATPDEAAPLLARVSGVQRHLIQQLSQDPAQLYALSPRQFEQVIAELLSQEGYQIQLTPPSRDGGRDIVASFETSLGRFLVYVECKRHSASRPVGVGVVRELLGVIHHDRATAGMVVTTSYFTAGAWDFARCDPYRLSLRDYDVLCDWLRRRTVHEL